MMGLLRSCLQAGRSLAMALIGIAMNKNDQVLIFDTTLRDGEQAPGASMNPKEKLEIAFALERLGVDIIEAGFPVASKGDFDSVVNVAKHIKNSMVCGLARSLKKDIDAAADAVLSSVASFDLPARV